MSEQQACSMNTLLPCPFCGHQPDETNLRDSVHPVNRERTIWSASCVDSEGGCNATVYGSTREDAIEKWNRRTAPLPEHEAQRGSEALRKALFFLTDERVIRACYAGVLLPLMCEREVVVDEMRAALAASQAAPAQQEPKP